MGSIASFEYQLPLDKQRRVPTLIGVSVSVGRTEFFEDLKVISFEEKGRWKGFDQMTNFIISLRHFHFKTLCSFVINSPNNARSLKVFNQKRLIEDENVNDSDIINILKTVKKKPDSLRADKIHARIELSNKS
ncbi:hypothetical protein TNCV_3957851 [Trichonephila clavipes]|nr:hypothetical protein TNCV_3957851 [Trichonephila clavipes]